MKKLNLIASAAIAALLLTAGAANASHSLSVPGASTTNVHYDLVDGVATVYGTVEQHTESNLIAQAVAMIDGVEEVNNTLLITQ